MRYFMTEVNSLAKFYLYVEQQEEHSMINSASFSYNNSIDIKFVLLWLAFLLFNSLRI